MQVHCGKVGVVSQTKWAELERQVKLEEACWLTVR